MADKGRRKGSRPQVEEFELEVVPEEVEEAPKPVLEETALPVEEARYFIAPQWYDQHDVVLNAVAQARFCSSCLAKLGSVAEESYPVIDPKTKRVTIQQRQVPFGSNPMRVIRDCCSKTRDYITHETPMLEAIFRVFLANGNQPMTLATLREHLLSYLPEMAALRSDYPVALLERMIRGDRTYGLSEMQLLAVV